MSFTDNIVAQVTDILSIQRTGQSIDLFIEGVIGVPSFLQGNEDATTTKEALKAEIKALDEIDKDIEQINIFIDSPGGSVFHALSMFYSLKKHPAKKIVEYTGVSASAATIIGAVADKEDVYISEYLSILVHEARIHANSSMTKSNLERQAKELDQINSSIARIYSSQNGLSVEENLKLMQTDNGEGVLLSAQEAKELGFIGNVIEINKNIAAVADFNESRFLAANWNEKQINNLKNKTMGLFDRKEKETDKETLTIDKVNEMFDSKSEELTDKIAVEFSEKFAIVEKAFEEKENELQALKEEFSKLAKRNEELEIAFIDAKVATSSPKPEVQEEAKTPTTEDLHVKINSMLRGKRAETLKERQGL